MHLNNLILMFSPYAVFPPKLFNFDIINITALEYL